MNRILYELRCKCKEKLLINKKRKGKRISIGKPLPYPYPPSKEISSKTFQIKYQGPFSITAKFILNNFQNKYIYYAIDDILYALKCNPIERNNLLNLLYSPILFLQNNFSVNFFEIWIGEVYIEELKQSNKFLKSEFQSLNNFNYLTITFFYKVKSPIKKQKVLW